MNSVATREIAVGILIFDDVEELDFVGPLQVFGSARECGAKIATVTIGIKGKSIRGYNGLKVSADHLLAEASPVDVLLVPGGYGTRQLATDTQALAALRAAAEACALVASVCTGARLLIAAGLVAGRRMTTHSMFIDELSQGSDVQMVRGERYVVDGKFVSSAGISAGIDMSLWLVATLFGAPLAQATRAYMEYVPGPPP